MSKFQLMTKDQEDLVAMVHDFMEKKVDPYVDQWDRESHCPMDEVRELMDLGFWGIDVPEEYGGAGLDVTTIMYIRQAMAYHDAGFTNTFSAQTFGWKPVLLAGTEEQKKYWGQRLAEGAFWAMCITEPQSGSDAGNCKTKAVKDGDEYVITGRQDLHHQRRCVRPVYRDLLHRPLQGQARHLPVHRRTGPTRRVRGQA